MVELSDAEKLYLFAGLFGSLAIHSALALVVNTSPLPLAPPRAITVEIVKFSEPKRLAVEKEQFVTPPDLTPADEPPQEARLLSEKNFLAKEEKIRRGDGAKASAAIRETSPLKHLSLESSIISQKILQKSSERKSARDTGAIPTPFSRPSGSGALFLGSAGSLDYLPNLPDGDLTLLNAKANRFAVFVRRVATRVFGQLRAGGWERLGAADIQKIGDFATVRAVLSPEGELLAVTLEDSSGSVRFDEVLSLAANRGARDPHPPREAAALDGKIHLIFKARSWARFASDPRVPTPFERRWLLLGTGLE